LSAKCIRIGSFKKELGEQWSFYLFSISRLQESYGQGAAFVFVRNLAFLENSRRVSLKLERLITLLIL